MAKYRKKPVIVEALHFEGRDAGRVVDWINSNGGTAAIVGDHLHIKTLEDGPNGEAKHVADPGDYIIRGVQGEFYACKPDIFAATYEPAE